MPVKKNTPSKKGVAVLNIQVEFSMEAGPHNILDTAKEALDILGFRGEVTAFALHMPEIVLKMEDL